MADFGIKPEIALGVKPPATMSLSDMLGIARGAQMYQKEREVLPLLVEQERIKTQTAQTDQAKNYANTFFQVLGGFANDPRVESNDPKKTVDLMIEVKKKARSMGVPESYVEALASPAMTTAAHNSQAFPQYINNVIQSAIGATGQQALQTPQVTTSGGVTSLFVPGKGRLGPVGVAQPPVQAQAEPAMEPPVQAPVAAPNQVGPQGAVTPQAQPPVQTGVTSANMTAPRNVSVGYPIRFQPRISSSDVRPYSVGEKEAIDQGTAYLNNISSAQAETQRASRNINEVIKIANELESKSTFQAGKGLDIERQFRQTFGEERYAELNKSLAQAQLALMKAQGGSVESTVGGQEMSKAATGDYTYPPSVLIKIARQISGEILKTEMESKAAKAAVQAIGPNNLQDFRQAWNENADLRIFEAIQTAKSVKDKQQLKQALDKILPSNEEELNDLRKKWKNIEKMTTTGRLQ